MTLYSYIVKHDTGFSPNPFFGYCTLACCKNVIRRKAQKDHGDWVVGLTPKADGNRIVFFMRVDDVKEFDEYWGDARFKQKKPRYDAAVALKCGDNAYEPKPSGGGYRQLPCVHSDGKRENAENKEHDLSGRKVLISERFAYFGSEARELPLELKPLIVGRGHRCRFSDKVKDAFLCFAGSIRSGVYAAPRKWPTGDDSWKLAADPWLIKR
jgi:hypothetical protein